MAIPLRTQDTPKLTVAEALAASTQITSGRKLLTLTHNAAWTVAVHVRYHHPQPSDIHPTTRNKGQEPVVLDVGRKYGGLERYSCLQGSRTIPREDGDMVHQLY